MFPHRDKAGYAGPLLTKSCGNQINQSTNIYWVPVRCPESWNYKISETGISEIT